MVKVARAGGARSNLAVVLDAPVLAFGVQIHHRSLGHHRYDVVNSQFHRFLYGIIHALTPRNTLGQYNPQR